MALTWDERSFDTFNGGRGMLEYATPSWWKRKCRMGEKSKKMTNGGVGSVRR